MSKLKDRIKALGSGLIRSFREFPVEALLSLTFFVFFILADHDVSIGGKTIGSGPFFYFLPLLILTFCLHRFARQNGRRIWTVLYIASWALCIPVLLLYTSEAGETVVVWYLLAFILLFAGSHRQSNETYAVTFLHTLVKGVSAILVGVILSGLISGILLSVNYLFFNGNLSSVWFTYSNAFIWLVPIPLLSCLFVSDPLMELKGNRFLTIVVDYLLSPSLLIYAVILYLYIIRILIRWELPEGGVAYMVGSFVGVALLSRLLQTLLEKRHFDRFYEFFPYIAIAPLVLLWIGAFRRIDEYGLTEARCYLLAVSILLTLFTGMLPFPKLRSFQKMSFILGAAAFILTFIPGIRAKDFGIRNQCSRLEKVLPRILEDGKLPARTPYRMIAQSGELKKAWTDAEGAWRYLSQEMDSEDFEARFGKYGQMVFSAWELEHLPSETDESDAVGEMVTYELHGTVNLGPYSVLLPDNAYYYYEDDKAVIFYTDASRTDELLRCDVAVHLAALASGAAAAPVDTTAAVLVYSNARYLAVFERITDYPDIPDCHTSFTTGRKMLFKKP